MIENLTSMLIIVGVVLVALVAIGLIFSRLYKRATKEVSFVRTGFGGQKVIMNGGAMVFPVLHEIIPVNMNTLRLEVRRANEQALITKDRMRVDVQAEFYVRVQPTQGAIADAAQTLGLRTMHPERLKELIEGKFVDALRAVAAEMRMEELHEQRVNFVQKVQTAVSEDLLKNGLELESASLTGLDQTNREYFNPDNAFDAEGLTTADPGDRGSAQEAQRHRTEHPGCDRGEEPGSDPDDADDPTGRSVRPAGSGAGGLDPARRAGGRDRARGGGPEARSRGSADHRFPAGQAGGDQLRASGRRAADRQRPAGSRARDRQEQGRRDVGHRKTKDAGTGRAGIGPSRLRRNRSSSPRRRARPTRRGRWPSGPRSR